MIWTHFSYIGSTLLQKPFLCFGRPWRYSFSVIYCFKSNVFFFFFTGEFTSVYTEPARFCRVVVTGPFKSLVISQILRLYFKCISKEIIWWSTRTCRCWTLCSTKNIHTHPGKVTGNFEGVGGGFQKQSTMKIKWNFQCGGGWGDSSQKTFHLIEDTDVLWNKTFHLSQHIFFSWFLIYLLELILNIG